MAAKLAAQLEQGLARAWRCANDEIQRLGREVFRMGRELSGEECKDRGAHGWYYFLGVGWDAN
jgi:hypothetical protein